MVTPFRFLAETSRPRGKWRSIFLIGGVVKSFFKMAGSSTVLVDVLSFLYLLQSMSQQDEPDGFDSPASLLCFGGNSDLCLLSLWYGCQLYVPSFGRLDSYQGQGY